MRVEILATIVAAFVGAPAAADVTIDGVSGTTAENVRANLGLLELDCTAPAWLVRWQHRAVQADVTAALEALGYYEAKVESSLEFPAEGCWQAHVRIVRGPPVRVASVSVDVRGSLASEPELARARTAAEAMVDKRLNHGAYEGHKRALLDAGREIGYFDARLTRSEVRVSVAEHRADVVIELDGGPRYRFGTVSLSAEVLSADLMATYAGFKSGDFYRADLVNELQRILNGSGYFGQVVVSAEPAEGEEKVVPVSVEVVPLERRWTYGVGAGYATDTGVRLRAEAVNPRVNRRGHRIDVSTLVAAVRSDVDATYRIPHHDLMRDWFAFNVAAAREETNTQTSDIAKVAARHSYERWGWVQVDFVELSFEDFEIGGESDRSRLVLFGSTVSRVWRDDPFRPRNGLRLSGTLRGATEDLGSDTDFAQLRVFGKAIRGLGERARVLLRGEAGWTWKDRLSDLPPSVRFFAGGDTSVRGYDYQTIGPEENGEVVGGSGLVTGSVEFDWSFAERWAVAAFADTGSAYDREPSFNTGVGLGVRWYSPVGAIRLDVAHPLDDPDHSVRVHVTLGPDL